MTHPFGKDALDCFVRGDLTFSEKHVTGTKGAFICDGMVSAGETHCFPLRLSPLTQPSSEVSSARDFDELIARKQGEQMSSTVQSWRVS